MPGKYDAIVATSFIVAIFLVFMSVLYFTHTEKMAEIQAQSQTRPAVQK